MGGVGREGEKEAGRKRVRQKGRKRKWKKREEGTLTSSTNTSLIPLYFPSGAVDREGGKKEARKKGEGEGEQERKRYT